MGTNYYCEATLNCCPRCGRSDFERLHIGKSSSGWTFAVCLHPELGIRSLDDWKKKWHQYGHIIVDEYHRHLPPEEMELIITNREINPGAQNRNMPSGFANWDEFHRMNYSEFGPRGLLRRVASQGACVGHGDGTWDYMIGDFS